MDPLLVCIDNQLQARGQREGERGLVLGRESQWLLFRTASQASAFQASSAVTHRSPVRSVAFSFSREEAEAPRPLLGGECPL